MGMGYAVKISDLKLGSIQRYERGFEIIFLLHFPRKWQFLPLLLIRQISLHTVKSWFSVAKDEVKLVAKEFPRFYLLPIFRTFFAVIANLRAQKMLVNLKVLYLSINFSRYKNTWIFGYVLVIESFLYPSFIN